MTTCYSYFIGSGQLGYHLETGLRINFAVQLIQAICLNVYQKVLIFLQGFLREMNLPHIFVFTHTHFFFYSRHL